MSDRMRRVNESLRAVLAEERGEMEGGEAVAGVGVRVAEPVEHAECSRVEPVERRVGRPDRLDESVVPAVAGLEESRDALPVARGRLAGIAREQVADTLDVSGCDQLEDLHAARIRS